MSSTDGLAGSVPPDSTPPDDTPPDGAPPEEWAVVPTDAGELPAAITRPRWAEEGTPLPGIVLVDGTGPGALDEWGEWPQWVADTGAIVLRHAKPGSGGAPGDWTTQSVDDRAADALAALKVLERTEGVDRGRVGLMAFAQGGWVAMRAAARAARRVDFLVTVSSPAVDAVTTERFRLAVAAHAEEADTAAVHGFFDTVLPALQRGDVDAVGAAYEAVRDEPWGRVLEGVYDLPPVVDLLSRLIGHDPAPDLERIRCPLLACYGAGDPLVPAAHSLAALAPLVAQREDWGVMVFPYADHGLFTDDPRPDVDRQAQLAPGFFVSVADLLEGLGE